MKRFVLPRTARQYATPILAWLLCCIPVAGADLDPGAIEYLGYFYAPNKAKDGFSWWKGGLSLVSGCLGATDPTPNDGYPGCLAASVNALGQMGVIDIVPPTMRGKNAASPVVAPYNLIRSYPQDTFPTIFDKRAEAMYDVYVEELGGVCQKIHWLYIGHSFNSPKVGEPVYGITDCSSRKPKTVGMWPLQKNRNPPRDKAFDGFHPNKWTRGILKIPTSIANAHFGGFTQGFASGKQTGSRGSSAGPSVAVRPEAAFSTPKKKLALKPLLYYRSARGYPRWYIPTEFRTTDGQDFGIVHRGKGGEFVGTAKKGAYVQPMRRPKFDPDSYPANDPNAGPTDVNEKYRDHPDKYPDPDSDVLTWYGGHRCDPSQSPKKQDPSFRDWLPDGSRAQRDCKIKAQCPAGKGPKGTNYHTDLVMYSLDDLAASYAGKKKPWKILPYAEIDITPDLSDDGHNREDFCVGQPSGTTYDEEEKLLYIAYGSRNPFVQVFRVGRRRHGP